MIKTCKIRVVWPVRIMHQKCEKVKLLYMYMFMYMSMLYIYGKIIFVRYFILPKLQEVKKMISQYGENMYMYMMCRRNDFKTQIVLFF